MSEKRNTNQGNNKPQQPQSPFLEHGGIVEHTRTDGRTTTTSQKPAPGHKK